MDRIEEEDGIVIRTRHHNSGIKPPPFMADKAKTESESIDTCTVKGRPMSKHFWSRGYYVRTVGLDEATIREYGRQQEEFENQQMKLGF